MQSTDVHRVTGLETRLAAPSRTAPAPSRWTMFPVSVLGIHAAPLALNFVLERFAVPVVLRVALVAVAATR